MSPAPTASSVLSGAQHVLLRDRPAPADINVLWIDDEVSDDDAAVRLLALEGFHVDVARSGAAGLAMAKACSYAAILLDLRLPDIFGLTVLQRLVAAHVDAPVLVVSGYYVQPEMEVEARRSGACAFLEKPLIGAEKVAGELRNAIMGPRPSTRMTPPRYGIVAASAVMRAVLDWIERVGPTHTSALLTGETGTGKELVAAALHRVSPRRDGPFIPVNCGAMPEGLLETELFGHRRGAFTGALQDKVGLFEAADGGTLFLDEVGDLPLPMQVRLLRSLEGGEVRRVGDTRVRRVDVRIVAATNQSLPQAIQHGRFRGDLYYRLAVATCHILPLRERTEDIEALVDYWLAHAPTGDERRAMHISAEALALLQRQQWPGNVRELRNALECAMCFASGDVLTAIEVSNAFSEATATVVPPPPVEASGADGTLAALRENHWNRTRTARQLGINRTTLWRRLKRSGGGDACH